ncbi:uncharacterized protein ALTATR162_LOCUS5746 [Alternaria atra]|uniref:Uncharacterized protein n=1 Tax=Alternaria atra TaxID=119953 RepID=A0A8J2N075_9PLEO|nr:uncharacterized protein ALTATR162_LOCUS5746 [Alternaria atra]CAG5160137.1 unnamed protein product [Alternaria atra]
MKFVSIINTLTSLTAVTLGSAVTRAMLPDCTNDKKGVTACGSFNSYGNDVFQCNNLRWDWIKRCNDPNVPCNNGACVPSHAAIQQRTTECSESQKRCLTAFDRGHDGIEICKNGKWEVIDPCRCNRDPEPQCMPIVSRDIIGPHQCTEDEPKCMLRNENGNGGVLFRCKNGFWKTQMHCRPSERCHDNLTFSTCSWLDAAAVTDDNDTSTTQVRRDDDEPTGQRPLTPTCADGEKRCYTKHDLHSDTYAVFVCENGKFRFQWNVEIPLAVLMSRALTVQTISPVS